jgi:hypothetical protein
MERASESSEKMTDAVEIGDLVHILYKAIQRSKKKEEVGTMGLVVEKEIRAYQLRNKTLVCPVCATDEERADDETEKLAAEDILHDTSPMECVRCKKKTK